MRQTKENDNKHLVYCIKSLDNGGIYIGYSFKLSERMKDHVSKAKRKNHPLYDSIKKYGSERHESFIIEEGFETKQEALDAEGWWVEYLKTFGARMFNLAPGGGAPPPSTPGRGKGRKMLEAQRLALSEYNKKLGKRPPLTVVGTKRSPETGIKISRANAGKKASEESKLKMRQAKLGKKASDEAKRNMSVAQIRIGRRPPIIKGSDNHLSKLNEEQVLEIRSIKNMSARQIGALYNVSKACILSILKRKTWKHI